MNFIADIGNTAYKFYVFNNDKIYDKFKTKSIEEAKEKISSFKKMYSFNNSIVSNVRSSKDEVFIEINDNFQIVDFNYSLKLPVNICYKTPESLGKDRLSAVCGAVKLFPTDNILVVDAGTAITYDFVEKGKSYIGGNISPGLSIRYKSLYNFTDNLPLLNIDAQNNGLLGDNTKNAITRGVQNSVLFEFNTYVNELTSKYKDLKVVVTGGDAFFFENSIKNRIFVVEFLTAIGLNNILNLNV